MRYLTLAAVGFLSLNSPSASESTASKDVARIADQREAMKLFDWMDGEWRGDASVVTAAGKRKVVQSERVGSMLGGTVKIIEGFGVAVDGTPVFNALAVISYDPESATYAFRSYANGHAGTFPVKATVNKFVWEVTAGPGATMRYTARRDRDQWIEVGDLIKDGRPPRRMFEMKLQRIGDTTWPAAR